MRGKITLKKPGVRGVSVYEVTLMTRSFDLTGDGTPLDPSISQTDADPSPDSADADLTRDRLIP